MISSHQSADWRSPNEPVSFVSIGCSDRPIVFLHGLFGSPEHWRHIMGDLAHEYRLIAPQLPVDRQPEAYRKCIRPIDKLTDSIADLIFELDLPPCVMCGNSLGGLVAIEICLRYPERVSGLVLAGSAGIYERSLTHGVRPQPTRKFVRALVSDIFHDPSMVTEELVDAWYARIRERDFVRFLLQVSRATRDRTLTDQLHQLRVPTLIVWGKNDKVTPPAVAESFKREIKHSQLRFIDNCGHAPNVEQPAIFSEMLQEFLPACFQERPAGFQKPGDRESTIRSFA